MTAEHIPSEDRLRDLLVGRKVVKAEVKDESPERWTPGPTGWLTLDDGTRLKLWGNDGGCACSAGCYPLAHLSACDNIITNVEVDERPGGDYEPCRTCGKDWCSNLDHDTGSEGHYRIFVLAENRRINLASFEGSDGNGYYGTGWWLDVAEVAA